MKSQCYSICLKEMSPSILVKFYLPNEFKLHIFKILFPKALNILQYDFQNQQCGETAGLAELPGLVVSLSWRWITRRKVGLLWIFQREEFVKAKMTLKDVTGVKNSLFQFPLTCQALGKIQTILASRHQFILWNRRKIIPKYVLKPTTE